MGVIATEASLVKRGARGGRVQSLYCSKNLNSKKVIRFVYTPCLFL